MTAGHEPSADIGPPDPYAEVIGEARWPMAGAVIAAIVLTFLLPDSVRTGPEWLRWALLSAEGVLLIAVIASDPVRISRRSQELHALSLLLVAVLVFGALWATGGLIHDLVDGRGVADSANDLLETGAIVWVSNNIAFALLYWHLDGGGAAARAHRAPAAFDFAFTQQVQSEVGRGVWRPRFVDYLYLGFTNALAFSPTDVMPLAPWAKLAMLAQSLISLAILALVVARAVNVFA